MVHFGEFWKPEACGQTVLPDRSVLLGQRLVKNAKIEKFKCDILGDFQTLCKMFIYCFLWFFADFHEIQFLYNLEVMRGNLLWQMKYVNHDL